MELIKQIENKVKNKKIKLIFPEGEDERVLQAIDLAVKKKIIAPMVVGRKEKIASLAKKLKINLKDWQLIETTQDALAFAASAVAVGKAQGMLAGAVYTTANVLKISMRIIGLKKEAWLSSFFLIQVPDYKGGEKGCLVYADASVTPNPRAELLAKIAVDTGHSVQKILGWQPKIALLSFSTRGSAVHEDVTKVAEAVQLAQKAAPELAIDGEFQLDTALVKSIAQRKIKGDLGKVAGQANVLIFPDLDAANIAYKLSQIMAEARAYGPILQGLNKPVSDLSRGATAEDIFGSIVLLSCQVLGK